MKKFSFVILFLITFIRPSAAQNLILNGSFEINTAVGNVSDLTSGWQSYVSDSWEVDGGTMDLIVSDDCGLASDGHWFVRTSPQSGLWPYMAFSLKLSAPLLPGALYNISFYKKYCGPNSSPIDIGVSDDSTLLGTIVHTFDAPLINTWESEDYTFTTPLPAHYITVNVGVNGGTGQIALDNFVLQVATGIHNGQEQHVTVSPNPFSGSITLQNILSGDEIEIDNLFGVSVYHQKVISDNEIIAIDFLERGLYVLQITRGLEERIIKLVKE